MTISSFKGTNLEITESIRGYVDEKLSAIVKITGDFEPAVEIAVECGKSTNHHNKGPYFRCEMNLTLPGKMLRAEREAEDLYEAIDAVKDELRRQVKDYKTQLIDKKHKVVRPGKE